jgi:hypothetical protein
MDESRERFAYRCLPLNIANAHGWEVATPHAFEALWSGRRETSSVSIVADDPAVPREELPVSHFGEGVLTFHVGFLFSTPPGYNLFVSGPPNVRKDGIVPLTGIVESDWLPYQFTMNWAMTRPGVPIRFEAGEAFCFVFPLQRDLVERVQPEIHDLSDAPELAAANQMWVASRKAFIEDLRIPGSPAQSARWQRYYMRATMPDGEPWTGPHQTRLKVRPFSPPPDSAESGVEARLPAVSPTLCSDADAVRPHAENACALQGCPFHPSG